MGCSSSTSAQNVSLISQLTFFTARVCLTICIFFFRAHSTGGQAAASGEWKEDHSFAQERDAKRTQFDKRTGKPVTVTEPKNKPDSV
jgi:hypothetical protein